MIAYSEWFSISISGASIHIPNKIFSTNVFNYGNQVDVTPGVLLTRLVEHNHAHSTALANVNIDHTFNPYHTPKGRPMTYLFVWDKFSVL